MAYGNYPPLDGVRRILVVKLRHLGDVLLSGPVFSALRKRLPEARIDAYIYEEARPILEGHPAVDEIIGYDRKWKKLSWMRRLFEEVRLLWEIRRRRYDLVLNLTEGDRGAWIARISGASIRVGVDRRRAYTHWAKACSSLRHTVERQLDALRRIGIFPDAGERELAFHIPEEARRFAKAMVPWEKFILIHPASRWRFKCWPVPSTKELCARLIEKGWKLVFASGPDEIEIAMVRQMIEGLDREKICDLAGKISLKELGALIEKASVLLCVDSVSWHLASALKAPAVVLFGPTSDITWGAWKNPRARVVAQPFSCRPCYQDGCGGGKVSDCLSAIPVERVLLELELVAEINPPSPCVSDELVDGAR